LYVKVKYLQFWEGNGVTFADGWTFAEGWIYTSPETVALLLPSPQAKRSGEVYRNWARYNSEHFNDILFM